MTLTTSSHTREILLVEDLELYYTPVMRWLREEGFQVTLAKSYQEAISVLDEQHFHLAIVDIRLVEEDTQNKEGLKLLNDIEAKQLKDVMPCIVLTARATKENILTAYQERGVSNFIEKKTGYREKLCKAVHELFDEKIKINFELNFDAGTDGIVADIANDVNWSMASKPQLTLLGQEVRDLFGKSFVRAKSLFAIKLNPGLTGAAVVRVQPSWQYGLGPSLVAKIGRRNKVDRESKSFEEYVKPYLPPNTITQVETVYTRHLGMLLYTFAESDLTPLKEFDEFYKRSQPQVIAHSLHNLFENTCRYWYDNPKRGYEDLPQLYYKAFYLDKQKLIGRIQIVLPQFVPDHATFQFNEISGEIVNPIAWLAQHQDECKLPVYHCITHGDLTGRNIMVSESSRCWLIDFYRTYPSHILRDFVTLETDIKYRMLPTPKLEDFLILEESLLKIVQTDISVSQAAILPPDIQKAMEVITALRTIAFEFSRGRRTTNHIDSDKEYLISLLMATLNVVRLRHIPEERKLQAMLSAALICAKLDMLAGREPIRLKFHQAPAPDVQSQSIISEDNSTFISSIPFKPIIQQKFLAEYLDADNLILFIGSDSAASPPFFEQVAAFKWPVIYTTNQHTYLENAFEKLGLPYGEITSPTQHLEDLRDRMLVYKLYGSLNQAHHHDPITLPMTDTEHRHPEVRSRLEQFLGKLKQDLNEGKFLLMLYPTEQEVKLIQDYCPPSSSIGLIWLVGSHLSEEEQDIYRRQDLRVVPNDPSDLLSLFSTLVQKYSQAQAVSTSRKYPSP